MLSVQGVVLSGASAITVKELTPYKQLKPNQAIKINEVEYFSRSYPGGFPVEVGLYYGTAIGAALEQDIHDQKNCFAATVLGRVDVYKYSVEPREPLLMNAESIGVYVYRTSETLESLVFKIWYEEITLSDTQLIQLNRNRGFSPFFAVFK